MTSFRDLKNNPNHPFWDFVASLDNTNNNNDNNEGPSSTREHRKVPWTDGQPPDDFEHAADPEEQTPGGSGEDEPMYSHPHDHGAHDHDHPHANHDRREHHNHRGIPGARGRGGRGGCRGGGGGDGGFRTRRGPPPPFGMRPEGMHGGGGRHSFRGAPFGGPRFGGHPFSRTPGNPPFDLEAVAGWIQNMFVNPRDQARGDGQDFSPAVDVFSTDAAYIVHVSLPGALKQDIAVNWSAETSTLIISGVITRPGVEDLVQITGERQVGAFERKISLGSDDDTSRVNEEGISAKLEDGVLKVDVPRLQREDSFVEVKRVVIE